MSANSGTLLSAERGEEVLFEGRPALVQNAGQLLLCILTLGLWLVPLWWRSRSLSYRVTNRRIVVQSGVLSQRLEQVDLYRVNDYAVERPFSQRDSGRGCGLALESLVAPVRVASPLPSGEVEPWARKRACHIAFANFRLWRRTPSRPLTRPTSPAARER